MAQTPLRQAIQSESSGHGNYTIQFPSSVCFGIMTAGGLVMAAIHEAAVDFVSHDPRIAFHTDVLNISLQFYRPTFPSPQVTNIELSVSNITKLATTLHVRVVQSDKPRLVGYITLTSLSYKGYISPRTNWSLVPAPTQTTIGKLEDDTDPKWIGYQAPFTPTGRARALAYLKYRLLKHKDVPYRIDQWVSPGWVDDGLPDGAVWTNELIHFIIDNGIPLFHDVMNETGATEMHNKIIRAGLAQREARVKGKSDRIVGEGLGDNEISPYTLASLAVTTEVKKLLPAEGVKWLFMRSTTTGILNNRMDHDILILDEFGELIASSHHVVLLLSIDAKDIKL